MDDLGKQESRFETPALELASCQASLAFERTLISLDQLLMGAVRTSLALITFGFAMVLFFHQLSGEIGVNLRIPARNFGLGLVAIGVGLVLVGLFGHRKRFTKLQHQMDELHRRKLLIEGCPYKRSRIAVVALLLLLAGLLVMLGIIVRIFPFG
jgi:putative membrane protein